MAAAVKRPARGRAAPVVAKAPSPVKKAAPHRVVRLKYAKRYTLGGRMYEQGVPTRVDERLADKLLRLMDESGRQALFEEVGPTLAAAKRAVDAKVTSRSLSTRQRAEREERKRRMDAYEDSPEEETAEDEEAQSIAGFDSDDEGGVELA